MKNIPERGETGFSGMSWGATKETRTNQMVRVSS